MFEHFGLMDVWSAIKRYKAVIFSIIIGSVAIFGGLGLIKIFSSLKALNNISGDKFISSASYYVEPVIDERVLENTDMSFYKTLPDDYAAVLNADFCMEYVYEQITSKYTSEYIVKNSSLGRGTDAIKPEELGVISMKELYSAGQYENTMLVNIFSETYDEKLSDDVLKACEDYLVNKASVNIKNADLVYAGGAKQTLSPAQAALRIKNAKSANASYKKEMSKSQVIIKTALKNIILPIFLIAVLCCIAACFVALFNPTLNRRSDFAEYNIPTIGEIENFGKIGEIK